MALNMYWATLFVLLPTIIVLTAGKGVAVHVLKRLVRPRAEDRDSKEYLSRKHEAKRFRYTFLRVYLLVMGAEWLQGPYLYTLLRDEKALDESTVASLYVVGYAAAAASALCAGFLADRYGRRRACLAFCLVHALSSMSVLSDSLPVLYAGRLCAGVALTLLWTVFESWMVTEFKARGLDPCCGPIAPSSASDMDDEWSDVEKKGRIGPSGGITLSSMFGIMTTSNCAAAMLGGVLGHYIVLILGSRKYPFVAALVRAKPGDSFVLLRGHRGRGAGGRENPSLTAECIAGRGGSCRVSDDERLERELWTGRIQGRGRQS
ncbi:hypothetical protein VTK73DRAFT_1695 [Phialemonium thermophilum]|uniref:Molybdate-anion transporter n=1 Tax=Phialemonium thermophilum TaxID=223376 RepID=A0ABR3X7Y1_9PEZI